MLWKKPNDMKFTDLCIFIDENVSNEDFFVKHYKISDNIENPYGGNFRFFGYSNEELINEFNYDISIF